MSSTASQIIGRIGAILAIAVWSAWITACANVGLVRIIRPAEASAVMAIRDGALIRSSFCDIIAEPVSEKLLHRFQKSGAFGGLGASLAEEEALTIFHLIITNTTRGPIWLSDARLSYSGMPHQSLPPDELSARLNADPESCKALMRYYRLLADRESAQDILYEKETVESLYPFISSDDRAIRLVVFDRPPPWIHRITLTLRFTTPAGEHETAIDFIREEYRTAGKEFRMPKRQSHDDEEFE